MGKYEELGDAVAQNPEEIEASDRIGSDSESFMAQAATFTRVSPAAGAASSTSSMERGLANSLQTAALIFI